MHERREVIRAAGGHEPQEVICEELRARALDGRVGVCGRIGNAIVMMNGAVLEAVWL